MAHISIETVPGRVRMRLRTCCLRDGAAPYVAPDPH